jgi:hypothetical protein
MQSFQPHYHQQPELVPLALALELALELKLE